MEINLDARLCDYCVDKTTDVTEEPCWKCNADMSSFTLNPSEKDNFIKYMEEKKMEIKYYLDKGAYAPEKAHDDDAGFDLRCPETCVVNTDGSVVIDTGVHVLIPHGYVGMLKSKSGLNVRCGLRGEGVIDAGYTGSIIVKMYNDASSPHMFHTGDKLIQLVILPIPDVTMVAVDSFDSVNTDRGDNGFGSSGV